MYAGTIKVAIAANVSYAIDELKKEFNRLHPDIKVQTTLGSSGKLSAQIQNGAPYQLFMSANMKYPQFLYEHKIAITKPKVYAQGALAFLSVQKCNFSKGVDLLDDVTIKKIAIANPKTAPYGVATVEALKKLGIYEKTKKKFVYGESISQTVMYALKAADIGIVAKSSLYSPKMTHFKKGVNWEDFDSKLYTPINQGIVIINNAKDNQDVKVFYDFMFSSDAKKILKKYGYLLP
jgi:molybdate transport system substrate-binding protein